MTHAYATPRPSGGSVMSSPSPPDPLLLQISRVVESLVDVARVTPDAMMVVGAWCRDLWHHRLGHVFTTTVTRDIDVALALPSWEAFRRIASAFPAVGDTGIRFRIAEQDVDVLPFGDVEDPDGTVEPPLRGEPMSVWAFEEIYAGSDTLELSPTQTIRIPTIPGYAALKLGAWLDRSQWLEAKDAADLALILFWYAEDPDVFRRLYETVDGQEALLAEAMDIPTAAAHLLGRDVQQVLGPTRTQELTARWPGNTDLLLRELVVRAPGSVPTGQQRRGQLLDALTRGLHRPPTTPEI